MLQHTKRQCPGVHGACTYSGTLPPSYGSLPKLRDVRFGKAKLTGPLPDTWAKLKALDTLAIWENGLNGG